jgi:hypothetical protein
MPILNPGSKIGDRDSPRTIRTRERSILCKSSRVVSTSPQWWEFLREQKL